MARIPKLIFKTKDAISVNELEQSGQSVVLSGINVLKDEIHVGDTAFVVFGGGKTETTWKRGLAVLAHIVAGPYDFGYDGKKTGIQNFRVKLGVDIHFPNPYTRNDFLPYPETYGVAWIAPLTKLEPNQAVTSVSHKASVAILQAMCEIRPNERNSIIQWVGEDSALLTAPVRRYVEFETDFGELIPSESSPVDLRLEFIHWAPHKKPGKNGKSASEDTIKKYIGYLNCLEQPVATEGKLSGSGWNGVIEYIYGQGNRQKKEYYQIDTVDEFDQTFGTLKEIFKGNEAPPGVVKTNYDKVKDWASTPYFKKHACFESAYDAYREFLEWRESSKSENIGESNNRNKSKSDIINIAIRGFAKHRQDEEWVKKLKRDGYEGIHARYEAMNPADLRDMDGATFDKWIDDELWAAKGTPNGHNLKALSLEKKRDCAAFIAATKKNARFIGSYFGKDADIPDGFGTSAVTELLMKFHPEDHIAYNNLMFQGLKVLGLTESEKVPNNPSVADYLELLGHASMLLKRLAAVKVPRSFDETADIAPDYITVNEFLWWCKEHRKEIENQVQESKMEPAVHMNLDAEQKDRKPKVNVKDNDDVLLLRLRAALRTKPFAILAGHSGTGKSRMVRKLAYMTCNDPALRYVLNDDGSLKTGADGKPIPLKEPGNFRMVQVKPNWHDSSDLLGYYSELGKRYRTTDFVEFICKAYAYPDTPFFVCLDEMNLAPVEQYFAEYLSAIESRKLTKVSIVKGNPLAESEVDGIVTDELIAKSAYTKTDESGSVVMYDWLGCTLTESRHWLKTYGLTIPRNLFVVGTVNMDESTNQFSRKVLDRAMTIEMTDADFDNFGAKSPDLNFEEEYIGDEAVRTLLGGKVQAAGLSEEQKANLNKLKEVLAPTSFAVAYRFANEYALYETSLKETVDGSLNEAGNKLELPAGGTSTAESQVSGGTAAVAVPDGTSAPVQKNGTPPVVMAEEVASEAPASSKKDPAIPSPFDDMVLMKVLPRISGDENEVQRIFYKGRVDGKDGTREVPADKTLMKILDVAKDTDSLRKIKLILDRGGSYLSFWP